MPGLLSAQQAQAPAQPQEMQPQAQNGPQGQDPRQQGQNAKRTQKNNPATKEQLDVISSSLQKMVYSEKGIQMIKDRLQGDPVKNLGSYIGRLLTMAAQTTMMEAGAPASPEVLFLAGIELSKAIGEIVVKLGVPKGQDAKIVEDAFFYGVQLFAKEAGEEALSQEERQVYVQLLDKVAEAKGGQKQEQPQEQQQSQQPEGAM